MAGTLIPDSGGFCVLARGGIQRVCKFTATAQPAGSWDITPELDTQEAYDLLAGVATFARTDRHLVLAGESSALIGWCPFPPDPGADTLPLHVVRVTQQAQDPLIAAAAGQLCVVVATGGDVVLRVATEPDSNVTFQPLLNRGRCGLLSGVAFCDTRLVASSHVFGECFSMDVDLRSVWKKLPTPDFAQPYLVAESPDRCVIIGKSAAGDWHINDAGRIVTLPDVLRDDEDPTGFALTPTGYALIAESPTPTQRLLVLIRDGSTCRIRQDVAL